MSTKFRCVCPATGLIPACSVPLVGLRLLKTTGFKDALRIGYQNRPDIFALQITLPEMLYESVIEIDERYSAKGEELPIVM